MSIASFQNYTQPLTLNGEVTINGTFDAKNIYVGGAVIGAGFSTDVLTTDNTWTGTNDYQNTTSYTGSAVISATDLIEAVVVDNAISSYNPLTSDNIWSTDQVASTFSNVVPPLLPTYAGTSLQPSNLYSHLSMSQYLASNPPQILNQSSTYSGTNNFNAFCGVSLPSLQVPTLSNQASSKAYVDGKIEVAGKCLTYTFTTPGTYNFPNVNRPNIAKIDFWLFGGSLNGDTSGSVVSGTIGNASANNGSLFLSVGTIADSTNYTTYDQNVASSTYLSVSNTIVGCAGGACILNGVSFAGQPVTLSFGGVYGLSAGGFPNNNNLLAYGGTFGTITSAGGAILVAYYI